MCLTKQKKKQKLKKNCTKENKLNLKPALNFYTTIGKIDWPGASGRGRVGL